MESKPLLPTSHLRRPTGRSQSLESTRYSSDGSHGATSVGMKQVEIQQPSPDSTASDQIRIWISYAVYAMVNVIISLPGLYGYAAVIFSHPIFVPHMNTLAKLVILSSTVHQLGFTLFSSLSFAIGTVQDAGLIFLASMSATIATIVLDSGGSETEVLSTTLILLPLGTAALGGVLVMLGHFRLADAVSYLPMPVVGGYLAFIGFFCLQAGTALCISESISTLADWEVAVEKWQLALPGWIAGVVLVISSRLGSDVALPATMVLIPGLFYFYIFVMRDDGLEGAREKGWIGPEAPPVPVQDLFALIKLSSVQWHLIPDLFLTWIGMVFVVSFASCLDVAAISMDMGEPLDTNKELKTVGYCNVMSGMTLGYTGSYIFSQTIFTYRTGIQSKVIGVLIMTAFFYVVISPINILQVAPLFFLGSTLIFIGYDLLYEWLFEIRTKIFMSEYAIVWATFVAIQLFGINGGIGVGILVSLVDHVVNTATQSLTVERVSKQSRAIWSADEIKVLQNQAYHPYSPRVVTLEIAGTVFFGSSLYLLQRLTEELGIDMQNESAASHTIFKSPHTPMALLPGKDNGKGTPRLGAPSQSARATVLRSSPSFVVLDLSRLSNMDASASRGCFLQLVKMCAKKRIVCSAVGTSPRVEWMLRSHGVAFDAVEEDRIKATLLSHQAEASPAQNISHGAEKLLLFLTAYEALEFCEHALLQKMNLPHSGPFGGFYRQATPDDEGHSLSYVFARILGCSEDEERMLDLLESDRYRENLIDLAAGTEIFAQKTHADAFYVVLKGYTAVALASSDPRQRTFRKRQGPIISGGGPIPQRGSKSNLLDPLFMGSDTKILTSSIWPVGGVFGYVDFLLERPRSFRTVATRDGTSVAKMTRAHLALLEREQPGAYGLVQRVLLQQSIWDLSSCTCDE